MQKIAFDFARMSDPKLDTFGERILSKMSGNSFFGNLNTALSELEAAVSLFRSLVNQAATRDMVIVSKKNTAKAALRLKLRQIALQVEAIALSLEAEVVRTCLLSSGFSLRKEAQAAQIPLAPTVHLSHGRLSGELVVKFEKVAFAERYEVRFREQGVAADWSETEDINTKHTQRGLTPGLVYEFQVRSKNRHGKGDWSSAVAKMCADGL